MQASRAESLAHLHIDTFPGCVLHVPHITPPPDTTPELASQETSESPQRCGSGSTFFFFLSSRGVPPSTLQYFHYYSTHTSSTHTISTLRHRKIGNINLKKHTHTLTHQYFHYDTIPSYIPTTINRPPALPNFPRIFRSPRCDIWAPWAFARGIHIITTQHHPPFLRLLPQMVNQCTAYAPC